MEDFQSELNEFQLRKCSFLAVKGGKTYLIRGRYSFGNGISVEEEIPVAQASNWRGWCWDGKVSSYCAIESGTTTTLFIRNFDGINFSALTSRQDVAKENDNWRGWNWDGKKASYIAEMNGPINLYIRSFNGSTFGNHKTIQLSDSDNINGWSWNGKEASYIKRTGSKRQLYIRGFDGIKLGKIKEIKTLNYVITGWNWD
ncbi:hypothetical protein [uncultured Algibacter sp.]|uniref:hypothetical protein n=1 Tax=uncultured Algibacter sp. TaxID=298659 RepID=UPI0026058E6B|nr:hypothetical protein [uncultured Algibacter sp.]